MAREGASVSASESTKAAPWRREVTAYQWFVFAVVSSAWMFDTLDSRLFSLGRIPALADLMGAPGSDLGVQAAAKNATAIFLIGWGMGGLAIGALGDRYGRVRLLVLSVSTYAVCSALTAMARTPDEFIALRLATGIGIGGVFGLAVAILSEMVSGTARLAMLALLQVLSTVGNILSAVIKMGVDQLAKDGVIAVDDVWRVLFFIGAAPIIIAFIGMIWLREPEPWMERKRTGQLPKSLFGSYVDIFRTKVNRRNLLIGTLLATAGVVGLWAIGEFAVDLQHAVFTQYYERGHTPEVARALVADAKNWAFILQMSGAALGMLVFGYAANRFGRRPSFILAFLSAFVVTVWAYWRLETPFDAYWMMPLMGAAQLGVFAGLAIYLPELFDAKSRGTGVSFTYNIGRFAAAAGSFGSAMLTTRVFADLGNTEALRWSAIVMCSIFLLGALVACFAPETKGAEHRP
jgi:MFS family permease